MRKARQTQLRCIGSGSGLLHSGNRDESQSMRDEERRMLANCVPPIRRVAFEVDLYMEAHRNRVGEAPLRISPFAGEPERLALAVMLGCEA
jgi:hypothetical protein